MVFAATAAVAAVIIGGEPAISASLFGTTVGLAVGTLSNIHIQPALVAGLVGGAIIGTGAEARNGSTGIRALLGTITGAFTGAASGTALSALLRGGWPFIILGTDSDRNSGVTYDCWKPVLHDTSDEPSNGMLMKDVVSHPHVAKVTVNEGLVPELPQIVLENIWNERFEIDYVLFVETGEVACHARPFNGESTSN